MEILTLGNETLRRKASRVERIGPEYVKIAEEMLASLHASKGVGLAGPQVGLLERIFTTHVQDDQPRVFINPSILVTSQETVKIEEGCLSIPGVYANVIRPRAVRVQAWNEKGRPFTLDAQGMLARAILHEYDHLDGMLFIDRLSEGKRSRLLLKYQRIRQGAKP